MKRRPKLLRPFLGAITLILLFCLFCGRYLWLGTIQEHRPIQMTIAAIRIHYGNETALVLERTPDGHPRLLLAMAAMERRDGDWPLHKKLEAEGLTYVDQMGSQMTYRNAEGKSLRYTIRMFTRSMMVAEAE